MDGEPAAAEPTVEIRESATLDAATAAAVRAIAEQVRVMDGVAPLSEETLLTLGRADGEDTHLLALTATDGAPTVAGYAHLDADESCEILVAPTYRRSGVGGTLLDALLARRPGIRLWAHGDLEGARALAIGRGMFVVRQLWQMALAADAVDALEGFVLPEGFTARAFVPGSQDEADWLRVNARAFAHHPEQGRMTLADLHDRMATDWFDPAGLILVHDRNGSLAASHWTKIEPVSAATGDESGEGASVEGEAVEGEVYVVAVDPDFQGRGLAKPLTALGLRHLRAAGVDRIVLYVDGDNDAAVSTYRDLGFHRFALDVMYSRDVHSALSR